jgi:DNA-binding NarL/FixJ family response regulator
MLVHVAVFDPLPAYRRGIMAALSEAGLDSEAPDDLMTWIGEEQRKVILLTLQSVDDWAMLAELRRTRSDVLIVAAIQDRSSLTYVRALTAGAVAVVPRDAPPAAVREAFEAVIYGKSVLPIDVLQALTAPEEIGPTDDTPSPQEIDWLRQLAEGRTIGQLAALVGYSERMMFRLLRDLYNRLHVKTRIDALMLARDRGWL